MKTSNKAGEGHKLSLARLMYHLSMLFESPEKKQFRRLKEFITG